MAIQKPYNINLSGGIVIPAEEDFTLTWSVSGAVQTHYALEIRNNSDNTLVHSVTKTSSYVHSYLLLANTLSNGNEYKLSITVWDESDNSATSDLQIFQTSSRPTVTLTPVGTIGSPAYSFQASYFQAESVPLRYWSAFLYDNNQNLINQSGLQTSSTIEHLFSNLYSEHTYFIEFQVTSEKGLINTTGKVSFNVLYTTPKISTGLTAENNDNASIKLLWNVVQIIGEGENFSYVNNEKIDVTNGKVWFDSGFTIEDNFTLKVWLESVTNTFINLNPSASIVASSTPISNTSNLWLEDSNQLTELTLPLIHSNTAPNPDQLWLEDENQTTPQTLGVILDYVEPGSLTTAWVDLGIDAETIELIKLNGSNATLYLRYFNNGFHLYKDNILVDSVSVSGSNYYISIQQNGENLTLNAEVLAS